MGKRKRTPKKQSNYLQTNTQKTQVWVAWPPQQTWLKECMVSIVYDYLLLNVLRQICHTLKVIDSAPKSEINLFTNWLQKENGNFPFFKMLTFPVLLIRYMVDVIIKTTTGHSAYNLFIRIWIQSNKQKVKSCSHYCLVL
jgi:hypothetical protein